MRTTLIFLIDLVVVVVFVAIGRSAHAEDNALVGFFGTAAPFLIAVVIGWAAVVAMRVPPESMRAGTVVWLSTWGIALVLRATAFQDGTAWAFVIVAGVTLALGLLGWRAVVAGVSRGRPRT